MSFATIDQLATRLPGWQGLLLQPGEFLPANAADVAARCQALLDEASETVRTYTRGQYELSWPSWEGGGDASVVPHTCWLAIWQIVSTHFNPEVGAMAPGSLWEQNWKYALRWLAEVREGKVSLKDSLQPVFRARVSHNTTPGPGRIFS
jgi:phage gp36-like protein